MGQGQPNGQKNQADAEEKETQGDESPATDIPPADAKSIKPQAAKPRPHGSGDSEHGPEIGHSHHDKGQPRGKRCRYEFPSWLTPEWLGAVSTFAAVVVAAAAFAVSLFGYLVSKDQLQEIRDSSRQTNELIAAAKVQAGAAKAMADVARDSFSSGQRAWLSPSQAAFADGVAIGEKIRPTIYHRNFGKSPALFVNVDMDIRIRPNESGHLSETTKKIIIDDANACLRKNYGTVGAVVFPESLYSYKYDAIGRDTGTPFYDIAFTDRMVSGEDVVIIDGCINYKTMGINAHTAFCFYYEAGESKVEALSICRIGNQAD